jgi:hypothetical protein
MGMLRAYADPPHFVLNAHYLASEIVTVHEGRAPAPAPAG